MSSYLTLLTLLLPFSALTNPTTPTNLKIRSQPPGDTLNVTRCYCASPKWATDHTYGYYYKFHYHNHHLSRDYPIEATCTSDEVLADGSFQMPDCLLFAYHKAFCTTPDIHESNTFCYMLGNRHKDAISFDKQRRNLPNGPSLVEVEGKVEEVCTQICKEKVGGMDLFHGEAVRIVKVRWMGGLGELTEADRWSHIEYFPEIDDMCDKCA